MGQEEKDILIKDLCVRLPYGVIVETPKGKGHVCDINLTIFGTEAGVNINATSRDKFNIEDIQPYLIPLSSMTVEQRCKVQNLLPNHCDISFKNQKITFYDEGNIQLEQLEKVFNFFNMHHIDYRGLIPMGLAIDATGLNIY